MTSEAAAALQLSMSEQQLQDYVLELAKLHKWATYHTYDSRRSAAGFPDLILCRGDRLLAVELIEELLT